MPEGYLILVVPIVMIAFLVAVNSVASKLIKRRIDAGMEMLQIKEEFEIRKSIFTIVGGVAFLFGIVFSLYEFGLKTRAEDRQVLYGALGQLIEVEDRHPEISAAAPLQLERLGVSSDAERPALVQIVTAYLNERAKRPVAEHDASTTARPDIQMAVYVLSRLLNGDDVLGGLVLLKEVDLRHVRMDEAELVNVTMLGVDLGAASMAGTDFSKSNLTSSEFKNAVLRNTEFAGAILDFVNFEGADMSNVDLCAVKSRKDVRIENLQSDKDARCITQ